MLFIPAYFAMNIKTLMHMEKSNKELLKKISEEFARGNREFSSQYLGDEVRWNILGNGTITGRQEVLEVSKMLQLESFPVITIKNVVAEGNCVVVESTGKAKTKKGKPYNQRYCEIFHFRNAKLEEITTYLDTALSNETVNDK
jgi:uncharacterized protein